MVIISLCYFICMIYSFLMVKDASLFKWFKIYALIGAVTLLQFFSVLLIHGK